MYDSHVQDFFKDKSVAVTGGLGSIGSALTQSLLQLEIASLRILDNRETELFHSHYANTDERVNYVFCDVQDSNSTDRFLDGQQIVLHAAAMKHVSVCESNASTAVRINVLGTENVANSSAKGGAETFLLISTDKAVNPTSVMGATKLMAEKLVVSQQFASRTGSTRFGVVRFGNVLYSRGSVLQIWEEQLQTQGVITLTSPAMTRFVMGIRDSIDLVLNASSMIRSAETLILKMASCRIADLATAFLRLKNRPESDVIVTSPHAGEKLFEELVTESEGTNLLENQHYLLKLPLERSLSRSGEYSKYGFVETESIRYSSEEADRLLSVEELQILLTKFQR